MGQKRPGDKRRDLTRLSADHQADDVVVELALRDVAQKDENTSYSVFVRTPGRMYTVAVYVTSGEVQSSLSTIKVKDDPECGPGTVENKVDCEGLVVDRDSEADLVSTTIPRTCLGAPRWVRVGGLVAGLDLKHPSGGAEQLTITADYWGPAGTTIRQLPPVGPKLRAG